ncbi:hypothetical protein [Streptosporangium sp. NPDC049078]
MRTVFAEDAVRAPSGRQGADDPAAHDTRPLASGSGRDPALAPGR